MNQNKPTKSLPKSTKKWWLLGLIVVTVAGGGTWFAYHQSSTHTSQTSDQVNYGPPTKEEQKAGDEQKVINDQADNTPPPTSATVYISDANQYDNTVEVRAYVANIAEDGGTCTATFSQGSTTFTAEHAAFLDASSTQCGALDVPISKFPTKGAWNVVVHYASAKLSGDSQVSSFTIK